MKKHSSVLLFLIPLLFISCKSLPQGPNIEALDLLDRSSAFYISIPSNVDPELFTSILLNKVDGITPQNAKKITERIDTVYCGLNRSRKGTEYQLAVNGDIPGKYIPKFFNPKKGWNVKTFTPADSKNKYTIYDGYDLSCSFPSSKIACAGRDVDYMLSKYDSLLDKEITEDSSELDADIYEWLISANEEIHFFANKPQSFLTVLTGTQLDLKLFYVKGSFYVDPDYEQQYILNLDFQFRNEKYRKAGKTLLTIAFGLTDSQTIIVEDNGLKISGIKLDKKQLYKLFME